MDRDRDESRSDRTTQGPRRHRIIDQLGSSVEFRLDMGIYQYPLAGTVTGFDVDDYNALQIKS